MKGKFFHLHHIFSGRYRFLWVLAGLAFFLFWFSLPEPLFDAPYARVVYDRDGELLGARIAADGQWRLPPAGSVPYKFRQSVVYFEDEWFYRHPGVNPVSLVKAALSNWRAGKIRRGGSTITMQVIRMAGGNPPRTYFHKALEIVRALRLELRYSKDSILRLYASHAPFGGNVVGLEAASWRYYGRPPNRLSWGESAALAVLPNAPSAIYPGKNRREFLRKRNLLLDKLRRKGIIDSLTCALAKEEPLPGRPRPLPRLAPHLLASVPADRPLYTSISKDLQGRILDVMRRYKSYFSANKIHNMGILVVSVPDGKVLAYAGNMPGPGKVEAGEVDVIRARRSTGSLLKPFLYAWSYGDGIILPQSLLSDIPTQIAGYHPENFDHTYDGAVPASEALARSLNVPAVRLLRSYGLEKFHDNLRRLHISTIDRPASHYGLSLILGGAEITLWEAVRLYAGMARELNRYNATGHYFTDTYDSPSLLRDTVLFGQSKVTERPVFGAGNIWFVFKALSDKDRPVEGDDWALYASARRVAWKTGTSFGHRDAWCVGVTPRYAVGVWVGNADGEGRPGLTGISAAAPVMFDVFRELPPETAWFARPDDLIRGNICRQSGYPASPACRDTEECLIPPHGERAPVCTYHRIIHLDRSGRYRVHAGCYDPQRMQTQSRFVLPPVEAWYYRRKHPSYRPLPPWAPGCNTSGEGNLGLIYPTPGVKIFLPRDFDGQRQKTVFKAVHRRPGARIYWHLDRSFLTITEGPHEVELYLTPGPHVLTLMDEDGEIKQCRFSVTDPETGPESSAKP
ncbi:MAG: penicillin-binding protein 1C [Chlorobi bacterium]|nr:penicillin-binding protein 1C [Chlorobiota bacterium]